MGIAGILDLVVAYINLGAVLGSITILIFSTIFCFMPYVCSLGVIAMAYVAFPVLQNWIPGHPCICFFIELAAAEYLTYRLLKFKPLSNPIIVFSSGFCGAVLLGLMVWGAALESVGLCIVYTIGYAIVIILCVKYNVKKHGTAPEKARNWFLRIIAAILYAIASDAIVCAPFASIWSWHFTQIGVEVPAMLRKLDIGFEIAASLLTGIWSIYHDTKQANKEKKNKTIM